MAEDSSEQTERHYHPGQRWISGAEPELGLGILIEVEGERIQIEFPATGETRVYAMENAPLQRAIFRVSDPIASTDGRETTVRRLRETNGLVTYIGDDVEIDENDLNASLGIHRPEDRLLQGQIDDLDAYRLRQRALAFSHRYRTSPTRGFIGGRIDLIPHQLYIAQTVSARQAPRVLLSDEVGLGKTIEACLILHRLMASGRVSRALVLVPESLVHQWFVELLRKFNLWFDIFDEERVLAIEAGDPESNPFHDGQRALCSIDFLANNPKRAEQCAAAGWDALIVDEAHHLEWAPEQSSPAYQLVEALCVRTPTVLLLTATPEQLGRASHFARLRLLDPNRFHDLDAFENEDRDYSHIARIVERLESEKKPTKKDLEYLTRSFPTEKGAFLDLYNQLTNGSTEARGQWIDRLLDLHGPGRALFRNTRAAMKDFPKRVVHIDPLKPDRRQEAEPNGALYEEFWEDIEPPLTPTEFDYQADPRVLWVVNKLKELAPDKVLMIARTKEKVFAIERAISSHLNIDIAIFHEDLALVQRDRNAAWFADEDGARLLICSEIGSEGRNFQFARHLIHFDLPTNPELVEQRIGRLDRIGQTHDIQIYVPYIEHSPQEILARWYHEGLDGFQSHMVGASQLFQQFGARVAELAKTFGANSSANLSAELSALFQDTASSRQSLQERLAAGRDRLLEMNSYRPATAQTLIDEISKEDTSESLEEFMLDIFEAYGVHAEELGPRTFQLNPKGVITDAFPALPEEGMIGSFSRAHALSREDVGFLTWDHPMVTGAIDLALESDKGTCSFAVWPSPRKTALILELVYTLEAIAETHLHIDRFLAPTPIAIHVDNVGDLLEWDPSTETQLTSAKPHKLLENPKVRTQLLPKMLEIGEAAAENHAKEIRSHANSEMTRLTSAEIDRLETLAKINDHIRPEEIELARDEQSNLNDAIKAARLRLDSLRMIWKGGAGDL